MHTVNFYKPTVILAHAELKSMMHYREDLKRETSLLIKINVFTEVIKSQNLHSKHSTSIVQIIFTSPDENF